MWTKVATALVPKILEDAYDYISSLFDDDDAIEDVQKKVGKVPDRTKVSIKARSNMQIEYHSWLSNDKIAFDKNYYGTFTEFCAYLNKIYRLNKSESFYRRVMKEDLSSVD